jgi:hypothetical protein
MGEKSPNQNPVTSLAKKRKRYARAHKQKKCNKKLKKKEKMELKQAKDN